MTAYELGFNDAYNNKGYSNPYVENTKEFEEYLHGYCIGEDMLESSYQL